VAGHRPARLSVPQNPAPGHLAWPGAFFVPVHYRPVSRQVLDEARPILLRLALTSTVSAGRVTPRSGGSVHHTSGRPSGAPHTAERFAQLISDSHSEREARGWLEAARHELQVTLRRPLASASDESWRELELRIVSEGAGFPAVEVAIMCKCTTSFVRSARIGAERDPEHGRSLAGVSRERWSHELRAAGYSLRQVSALTGIPRSTLSGREH
jgi:hypothetical protein